MTCWASVAPRPPCSARPAQAGPARRRQVPVPGQPLGVCLVLATGAARPPQRGEAAGEVVRQPLPDLMAELLVLRAQRTGASCENPLVTTPRARGGMRARGSSVPGQRAAAARRLSLPSTCFVGGVPVELTIPAAVAQRGAGVRRRARPGRAGRPADQLSRAARADHHGRTGAHRRGRGLRGTGWPSGPPTPITGCSARSAHCTRARRWSRSTPGSPAPRRSM